MISEQQLDGLFAAGADPYGAAAAAMLDKPLANVTQEERDLIKRVFLRVQDRSTDWIKEALGRSASLFHEVGSALSVEKLLMGVSNPILVQKLGEGSRTSDQLRARAAEGFELCVRALAKLGAPDVTIHECGESAAGEVPWGAVGADADAACTGTLVHDEFTACPAHDRGGGADATCTGTLVHGEYAWCPVHDDRRRVR